MSLSSSAQKDYRPLSNCHAHLNAKKSSTSGNMSITNDTNNGNVNSENNSIDNSSNSVKSSSKYLTIMGTTEENLERQSNDESVMLNSNHYRMQHQHQQERIHQQHNNNNTNKSASPSGNDSVISVNSTTNINTRKSFTGTDPSNASFSSASVTGSVQDDNMSDDQCSLTQAGLEEYNSRSYYDQPVFHHQKQSSYAQSEGYHSYVSSSDSSSATPFLDRLRQESELLSRQSHHWSQNDLSSSLNNVSSTADNNNSSESTSSTETLKWLGSMSDVSVASHASSAISGSVSSSQLIVHSSKVRTPKRHNSESVLYMNDDQISVANDITAVNNSGSGGKIQQIYPQHPHYHQSPSTMKGLLDHHHSNSTVTSTSRSGSPTGSPATMMTTTTTSSATSSSSYRNNHRLFPVSTYTEPVNGGTGYHQSPQLHHHHHQYQQQQSAQPQTQQQQHSASSPSSSVVSSSSSSVANQQLPGIKLSSPQSNNWQSVADRINDFERQQQHLYHYHALQNQQNNSTQKYTYIDPSKTHRVPNPTLKAFQKNAVQSYFERQQQNAKENSRNYSSNNGNIVRPQSLQPQGAPKEVPTPQIRTSLPNNYVMSLSSQRCSKSQQMSLNNMLQSPLVNSDGSFSEFGVPPPPPPPRSRSLMPIRRSSSASDYADFRENFARAKERQNIKRELPVQSITNPEKSSFNNCGMPPPPPPPRGRTSMPVRRTSSASDYAGIREKNIKAKQSLSSDLLGPIIMGPIISVDDWVPERPPKNPHLRIPSPDLPPPPLQATDTDVNLTDQDEPLPPPPPEILRYVRTVTETDNKSSSPNRRNSFAGSPSRKSFYRATTFENLSPPSIPKKPPAIEILHCRPASSLAQSNKAHKVILNGKLEGPNCSSVNGHINGSIQDQLIIPRGCDSRMSVRKRAHNSHALMTPSPDPNRSTSNKNCLQNVKSPPPLKPRMPIAGQEMRATSVAINSKLRCNSKASYLPRQSRDKLNSTDPDHGSYKLTLTSNEDSISQNTTTAYHDDILSTKCNNLPDVLPVGAKVQSSSPSSSSNSSPRYGSNNNINNSTPPHTAPPIISNYPMKSLFHFQNSINNNSNTNNSPRSNASPTANSPPAYNSPHRLSPFISSEQISPKFMSQSTIDLKKTHVIESTEITPLSKMLSPAQSENNISSHEKPPLSPFSARREKQRTEIVRKLSLEEKDSGEGRIVRAELVNTILSSSPTRSEEKIMIRKDSFRENIEKITQLQSKLMTAHLVDNGGEKKLLGYTGRTVELKAHQQVFETETSKSHESLSTKSSSSTKVLFNPSEPPTSPPPPTPTSPPPNNIEPLSQMDTEIDGLKLMQRTEIILRLNAPTMEAASQTDETHELEISRVRLIDSRDDVSKSSERLATSALEPRKRLPEEIDCDILSKELADCLPITDKLCQVLAPKIYKVASDYVGGLYNPHVSVKLSKKDISTSTLNDKSVGCELIKAPNVELHGTASSTAERLDREVRNVVLTNGSDSCDLNKKKEELINRLTKAVEVLISEQTSVSEKSATNELLGSDLAAKIAEKVRPIEASKFRAYIDDVGHITMLLLSLSGRLAKLENVLHSGSENHPEKKIFEVKRDRLLEQLEEAKRLKEDIDRRGTIVSKMLEKHLTTEEYVDYEYFINMKAKLIVDSREITERIKLNEEQLTALKSTLVQADC